MEYRSLLVGRLFARHFRWYPLGAAHDRFRISRPPGYSTLPALESQRSSFTQPTSTLLQFKQVVVPKAYRIYSRGRHHWIVYGFYNRQ